MQTRDGLAGGSGLAPWHSHRLYFGELVLSQGIIDSGVVAMLEYAIEVRKATKLSSDVAQSADGTGEHLDRKCSFDLQCSGPPPPMKHLNIRWNSELQEWLCLRCGQSSDHAILHDAQVEMEQFECDLQTMEPKQNNPPGRQVK
jgi:hypothetical protein